MIINWMHHNHKNAKNTNVIKVSEACELNAKKYMPIHLKLCKIEKISCTDMVQEFFFFATPPAFISPTHHLYSKLVIQSSIVVLFAAVWNRMLFVALQRIYTLRNCGMRERIKKRKKYTREGKEKNEKKSPRHRTVEKTKRPHPIFSSPLVVSFACRRFN